MTEEWKCNLCGYTEVCGAYTFENHLRKCIASNNEILDENRRLRAREAALKAYLVGIHSAADERQHRQDCSDPRWYIGRMATCSDVLDWLDAEKGAEK